VQYGLVWRSGSNLCSAARIIHIYICKLTLNLWQSTMAASEALLTKQHSRTKSLGGTWIWRKSIVLPKMLTFDGRIMVISKIAFWQNERKAKRAQVCIWACRDSKDLCRADAIAVIVVQDHSAKLFWETMRKGNKKLIFSNLQLGCKWK